MKVFDFWKTIMPVSTFKSLVANVSVSLLRTRARVFDL